MKNKETNNSLGSIAVIEERVGAEIIKLAIFNL